VTVGTQLALPQQAPPGILVLHRHFLSDPAMLQQVNRLAERGWLVISDIDDDPHHWAGYVDSKMVAFKGVHAVTVSTDHLAALVRQLNPQVEVFQNMVDDLPPALNEKRSRLLSEAAQGGSRSQDHAIRVFFGAFNRQPDVQSLLEGVASLPDAFRSRIHWVVLHDRAFHDALPPGFSREFHPTCPWAPYMQLLSSCDVAALPLNDTAFNRFKSDLKLIEALAAGAVPICSPVVYRAAHGHAPYVRWADKPADWAEQLANALSEPEVWERARLQGYRYVHEHRLQWHQDAHRIATYRQWMADQPRLEAERQERLRKWRAEVA
jgi:glycosyltransferase involved in cell wall biosynthesis